jgi:hypothetical protein
MSRIRVVHSERRCAPPTGTSAFVLLLGLLACTNPNPKFGVDDGREDRDDAQADVMTVAPDPRRDGGTTLSDARQPDLRSADAAVDGGAKSTVDLNTGLIGYWKFDEASGTAAADSSGMGNAGTLEDIDATNAWVAGRREGALRMTANPITSGVRIARTTIIDGIKHFTIAAWVYLNAGSTALQTVLSRQVDNNDAEVFNLCFASQILTFYLPRGTGLEYVARDKTPTPLSRWVHVAATYDGTTGHIYSDGVSVDTITYSTPLPAVTTPLYLGTNKNSVSMAQPLQGLMDDVLLYNRALPPDAIAALAGGTVPAP